jgi:hypothetical protein
MRALAVLTAVAFAACVRSSPAPSPLPVSGGSRGPTADAGAVHAATAGRAEASAEPSRPPIIVLVNALQLSRSPLAVDATSAYWLDSVHGLARAPKMGGTPTAIWPEARDARFLSHSSIAVDATAVYFTYDTSDSTEPGRQRLIRYEKDTGKTSVVAEVAGGTITSAVVDDTHVYWIQSGFVLRAPKTGGRAVRVVSGRISDDETYIAVDDARVYWTPWVDYEHQQYDIRAATTAGADARVLVRDVIRPHALIVDGEKLYWASGAKLMAASKTGGAPMQLAEAHATIGG